MKLFAVLLGVLALVAGFTGGLRAYSLSSDAAPAVAPRVAVHHYPPAQVVRPGPILAWAPCRRPAVREGRACVTHVTRVVPLPTPTVTAPAATPTTATPRPQPHATQPAPATPSASPSDDGGGHHDDGGHDDGGGGDD